MKETNKPKFKGAKAVSVSFLVLLFAGAAVALYLPLRPTYSEAEKRELTKFPEFSFASLADGSYFNGISTWYADTFPWRETFMNANAKIKSFQKGIFDIQVYGIGEQKSRMHNSRRSTSLFCSHHYAGYDRFLPIRRGAT